MFPSDDGLLTPTAMKVALLVVVVVAILTLAVVFLPNPCSAGWCYGGSCWTSRDCGRGCACMKEGGGVTGSCVSFDRSEWDYINPAYENEDSELDFYIQGNYMLKEVK